MNKAVLIGIAVAVVASAGVVFMMKSPPPPPTPDEVKEPPKPKDAELIIDETERAAYVEASVRAVDVKVAPDTKPGSDVVVPGLLRVTGTVSNSGDKKIDKVTISILPEDADGNVIASYQENVAKGVLDPGATRPFQFTIPANAKYAGTFKHKLH